LIGASNGAQAMRDDKCRSAGHESRESFLDQGFAFGIEARCRLIQNEDSRISQNRSRDSHSLALTS
jgi:hypothetical protein